MQTYPIPERIHHPWLQRHSISSPRREVGLGMRFCTQGGAGSSHCAVLQLDAKHERDNFIYLSFRSKLQSTVTVAVISPRQQLILLLAGAHNHTLIQISKQQLRRRHWLFCVLGCATTLLLGLPDGLLPPPPAASASLWTPAALPGRTDTAEPFCWQTDTVESKGIS